MSTIAAATSVAAVTAPAHAPDRAREAATAFEGFFISQLLNSMSAGLSHKGMFTGGAGEEAWRGELNQQYGKVISRQGGFGLGDAIYKQILRLQEAQPVEP